MITAKRAKQILFRIDTRRRRCDAYTAKIAYIQHSGRYNDSLKQEILKDSLWVDGTLSGQLNYIFKLRAKLQRSYDILYKRFKQLGLINDE